MKEYDDLGNAYLPEDGVEVGEGSILQPPSSRTGVGACFINGQKGRLGLRLMALPTSRGTKLVKKSYRAIYLKLPQSKHEHW